MKFQLKFIFLFFVIHVSFSQDLKPFIPLGFEILDSAKCDVNQDGFIDYIVILKHKKETTGTDIKRPLLIIEGNKNGTLKLVSKNDDVVLCYDCGGVFGDPYSGITVKKNYFSIEHYGGSNWRWTRIITFKYDPISRKYILHKDAGESYHVFKPNNREFHTYHKPLWGNIEFGSYKNEA